MSLIQIGNVKAKKNKIPTLAKPFAVITFIGFLFLAVIFFQPLLKLKLINFGNWASLTLSLGLIVFGSLGWIYYNFANTIPGIKHNNIFFNSTMRRGLIGWSFGILITGFYIVLYFYEKFKAWGIPPLLDSLIQTVNPLSLLLSGQNADRWFLYGTFYTMAVLIMGVRMLLKYRHNRYQQIRTLSVMFFQLGFAFLIPAFLKAIKQPEFYFTYFWPLKPDYLFPWGVKNLTGKGSVGMFMICWGIVMTFIATPVLTYFFGKRWYCSWVCGCGGLAETLGDPFRQNSDKSEKAWILERWLIHSVLLAIIFITILLWTNDYFGRSILGGFTYTAKEWYGFYIGAIFSGVIGVGFYPILGSRVWCRFGCPMAAILGILQRSFSKFRITVNGDQCISCGNCSTYCEMGIDVRAYAQRGENIVRSSCVGCGVCAAVCPRGVLALENGPRKIGRFTGSNKNPLAIIKDSLLNREIYSESKKQYSEK